MEKDLMSGLRLAIELEMPNQELLVWFLRNSYTAEGASERLQEALNLLEQERPEVCSAISRVLEHMVNGIEPPAEGWFQA